MLRITIDIESVKNIKNPILSCLGKICLDFTLFRRGDISLESNVVMDAPIQMEVNITLMRPATSILQLGFRNL